MATPGATAVSRTAEGAEAELQARVREAIAARRPLAIRGGASKLHCARPVAADELDTRVHAGIVRHEPSELVITAHAGTPLAQLEAALAEHRQLLGCEPPHFGGAGTVGGMVAAGLSGPRRPWAGAVRDYVLGLRLLDGEGRLLRFGGEVMKNVAGYDLSRLMAGAFGCLGLVTEVSLKVVPGAPAAETRRLELPAADAMARLRDWGREVMPITAAAHDGQVLHLRLEGGHAAVQAAARRVGGDRGDAGWWPALRDHRLGFFDDPRPLWRLSLPPEAPPVALPGDQLLDWGGAQRWLKTDADAGTVRSAAVALGGHASCFTPGCTDSPLHPLPAALLRYHRALKAQLDPHGVFNPGRMHAGL